MVTFVMIIAVAWSFVGAWFVLPFAGIEVGLMAYFMYHVSRQCHACQVITIEPKQIEIACGIEKPQITQTFERIGTHLTIVEPIHPMDKAKLAISDDHQCFEIGQFLNQQDCQQARESLIRAGLIPISNQWWKRS